MLSLGIEYGTTNTVAALCGDDGCDLVALPGGLTVTPSVVRYMPDGSVNVGTIALEARPFDPRNTIYSIKRVLGRPWHSREVLEYRNQYPFDSENGANNELLLSTRAGKVSPVEVAAHVFRFIGEADAIIAAKIGAVAITVPVAARQDQRTATVAAAARGGFSNLHLNQRRHRAPHLHPLRRGDRQEQRQRPRD